MTALAITATTMLGARAKSTAKAEVTAPTTARKRSTSPGSRAIRRVPTLAPMTRPTSCTGSTPAAMKPRCTSSSLNTSS